MNKRFQYNITTGRFTLLAASILSLVMFLLVFEENYDFISLGIGALITYMIIEFNRVFAIIRTRTFLPSAMFILFYAGCPTLLEYGSKTWIPLLMMVMLLCLFSSHNQKNPSTEAFNTLLCLSLSSLFNPYLLYLIPILYIGMSSLHSLNIRSFLAGMLGLLAPYVIYATYLHLTEDYVLGALQPLEAIAEAPIFAPFHIIAIEDICYGVLLLLVTITGSILNLRYTHKVKEECRRLIRTLIIVEFGLILLSFLQPATFYPMMTTTAIISSILNGHLFTIENNRLTHIYLISIIVLFILCSTANIWIQLYNS